ncbi:MAG: extracellular solute-binding protein [Salinibacterium sp.]|nr:extracellular solute-binding protein [Salinibacterium sp.]
MKATKLRVGIALALPLALVLTSCSAGGTGDVATTLTVQTDSYALPGFQLVADKFEAENPGVTVEFQVLTPDQQSTTNLQVLTSSDAPDIASAPFNSTVFTEMLAADQFLPIDDVWADADLQSRYGDALANAISPEGKKIGVLFSKVLYGIAWYNKAIFAEAGIDVPADHQIGTMDNLKSIVAKIRAAGYQPLSIGGSSNYHFTWILDNLLATATTPEELTNYTTSFNKSVPVTSSYTDAPFTKSLDRIKEMYDDGVFQDGVLGMDQDAALALFAAGQAGMMMGHNQSPAGVKGKDSNVDMGFLFLPPISAAVTQPDFYAGNLLEIPVNAKNPDLAKKFLIMLMSDEMQVAAIEATGGALPGISITDSTQFAKAPESVRELIEFDAKYGNAAGWASLVPAKLGTTDPLIQKLVLGETTSHDIGVELDALLEEIRNGG